MCYIDKSIEQVTSTCAMCKVFPPRHNHPCPHKDNMGVCKNRVNHPRHDVVYFRNAELTSFNGCGYCKWAKRNSKLASPENISRNPGWPGCCRPPKANEYEYINAADWYAISKIHGIVAPSRTIRPGPLPVTTSIIERRNSNPVSSSRRSSDTPPSTGAGAGTRQPIVTRETTIITLSPKLLSKPATSSIGTIASTTTSPSRSSPPLNSSTSPSTERRVSTKTYPIADTPFATLRGPPPGLNSNTQPLGHTSPPRPVNPPPKSSASVSSSSSSRSSGSITQSETVTSEGFTDYLSDESEAEMQREAERRATEAEIVARLQRTKLEHGKEEQEFRAARTQLATVGLQPPPAWSTGKPINNTATKESPPPPVATTTTTSSSASTSTPRPSRSAAIYNAPMVQVYTSVRQ